MPMDMIRAIKKEVTQDTATDTTKDIAGGKGLVLFQVKTLDILKGMTKVTLKAIMLDSRMLLGPRLIQSI